MENQQDNKLFISHKPDKISYKPGENISFEGIRVGYDDRDVTNSIRYNIENDYVWKREDKKIRVVVSYVDDTGFTHNTYFYFKRKKRVFLVLIPLIIVALAVVIGFLVYQNGHEDDTRRYVGDDTGSSIIDIGGMSREEAQQMLNDMTDKSRIKVSLAPEMELKKDGSLRVNFAVDADNNGFSERLEVKQGDDVVYKSGVVEPGYMIEWTAPGTSAYVGEAIATVYAVSPENNSDSGNPASVVVQIVEEGNLSDSTII